MHQSLSFGREQLFDGALVDFFLKCIAHHTAELNGTGTLIETDIANVFGWVADAPTDIPVDDHALLLGGQHGLGVGVIQGQQALVNVVDILKRRRHFEMQTRLGDHAADLPQRIDHAELTLVDDKHGGRQQNHANQRRCNVKTQFIHVRIPFSVHRGRVDAHRFDPDCPGPTMRNWVRSAQHLRDWQTVFRPHRRLRSFA